MPHTATQGLASVGGRCLFLTGEVRFSEPGISADADCAGIYDDARHPALVALVATC
jgi:hypothetical protein